MEQIGLYHAQGMVLLGLFREDGVSQSELAAALHVSLPTISNTLQRMERDGWVVRRRDEADQRVLRIYLTDKSKKLRDAAHASFQDLDEELVSVLPPEELEGFRQSLFKVLCYLLQKNSSLDAVKINCSCSHSAAGERS